MAPDNQNSAPSWPPRSPHEALLSTPKGRQRYREMMNSISPTSSPAQRRSRASLVSPPANMQNQVVEEEDDDEDEDEETLQLKLQEIQARLKLKRLQRAKGKEMAGASKRADDNVPSGLTPSSSSSLPQRTARLTTPDMENRPRPPPPAQTAVEVPASPVKKAEPPLPPKSPSRVLLGIDKGLKAKDISLKRAPSFRRNTGSLDATNQKSDLLTRSKSFSCDPLLDASRPRSFNERLASARTEEAFRAKRQERIHKLRSNTFSIGKEEMEEYKRQAVEIPDEPLMNRSFTRDDIVGKARSNSSSGTLTSSQTAPSSRSFSGMSNGSGSDSTNITSSDPRSSSMTIDSLGDNQSTSTSFDTYSSFHLSKRILPHTVLARHVSGKKTLCIKDLLRTVKAPDFALPDIEQDIVVFAIVARKSEPRAHKPTAGKNGQQQDDSRRYMVLNLVDLEYELDLFLFNTGFNRYWKLTEGTVVAILNPNVMPPPPGRQDTGRFSLVINSDEDTILEVGMARDLGFCQSMKKDGDLCNAWVNRRRTQFCEFHSNEAIRKQRSTRMEVNSQGFGGRDRFKSPQQQQQQQQQQQLNPKNSFVFGQNAKKKAENYDWETKSHWFVSKTHSAADLIDGKDRSAADRKERAEFLQRSMEAKEREREMMKKLGKVGHAAGKEYMQRSGSQGSTTGRSSTASGQAALVSPPPDAAAAAAADEPVRPGIASLALDKDREIHLSPIKRKRTGSSNAGSINGGSNSGGHDNSSGRKTTAGGFGWGSDLKVKLSSMRDGEKMKPEQPPLRKKTRFVTDKGILVAGRESFGNLADRQIVLGTDDDDDELVIVN